MADIFLLMAATSQSKSLAYRFLAKASLDTDEAAASRFLTIRSPMVSMARVVSAVISWSGVTYTKSMQQPVGYGLAGLARSSHYDCRMAQILVLVARRHPVGASGFDVAKNHARLCCQHAFGRDLIAPETTEYEPWWHSISNQQDAAAIRFLSMGNSPVCTTCDDTLRWETARMTASPVKCTQNQSTDSKAKHEGNMTMQTKAATLQGW